MDHTGKISDEIVSDAQELMTRIGYVRASLRCLVNAVTYQKKIINSSKSDESDLRRLSAVADEVLNQMCLVEGLMGDEDGLAGVLNSSRFVPVGVIALIDCLRLAFEEVPSLYASFDKSTGLQSWPSDGEAHDDVMRVCSLANERMGELEKMCERIGVVDIAERRRSVEPVAA